MRSLSRRHASHVLAVQLRRRTTNGTASNSLQILCSTHVFPDEESSSLNVARSLLPTMRKLKWCLQRDRLAKVFKVSGVPVGIGAWLDRRDSEGRKVVKEGEKVRLAVCPNIKTKVRFYERLGKIWEDSGLVALRACIIYPPFSSILHSELDWKLLRKWNLRTRVFAHWSWSRAQPLCIKRYSLLRVTISHLLSQHAPFTATMKINFVCYFPAEILIKIELDILGWRTCTNKRRYCRQA